MRTRGSSGWTSTRGLDDLTNESGGSRAARLARNTSVAKSNERSRNGFEFARPATPAATIASKLASNLVASMDNSRVEIDLNGWKEPLVADLEHVAMRDRWGRVFLAIGWIHLAFFLVCQAIYSNGDRRSLHFLSLWTLELVANLIAFRRIAGPGWRRSTPLAPVLVRVWATFFILSFNVASLNTLTGFEIEWFKPVWGTLSTFGFATTAYLVNLWYFAPAVLMYFSGLLMVRYPDHQYLIYGISWWFTLMVLGAILERRRLRGELSERIDSRSEEPVACEV
jgi:hypothetical protein